MPFFDRVDAGRRLATLLEEHRGTQAVVYGLARGGVIVAERIASALALPLDVLIVRKIGAPGNPELAVGALAEGDEVAFDDESLAYFGLGPDDLEGMLREERRELSRRVMAYRNGEPLLSPAGHTAILVDDGAATGLTALASVRALKKSEASQVIVAVPICSGSALSLLDGEADDVVALEVSDSMGSVGAWYDDFRQVSDGEVRRALSRGSHGRVATGSRL